MLELLTVQYRGERGIMPSSRKKVAKPDKDQSIMQFEDHRKITWPVATQGKVWESPKS